MSKNIFDYIQMGLRSKRQLKNKEAERQAQAKKDANDFNKAFTDKTYSVAKKVMENVEKVADYDYESFFSRVNKVFEDPNDQSKKPIDRETRSRHLDEKLNEGSFDINQYVEGSSHYKDSIIEKTKRNIQKKMEEADHRANKGSDDQNLKAEVKHKHTLDLKKKKCDKKNAINITKANNEIAKDVPRIIPIEKDKLTDNVNEVQLIEPTITKEIIEQDLKVDELSSKLSTLDTEKDHVATRIESPISTEENMTLPLEDNLNTLDSTPKCVNEEIILDYAKDEVKALFNEASYSTHAKKENSKYFKRQKKKKFAKRITVNLDDNMLASPRKSFARLFKFSLSFKLSFVFIILLILAVVSLSVAFYFGIDFVIDLDKMGKLDDVEFFKNVLLILLIIFDLITILLVSSIATKTSRGLVSPLNEMTRIVQQINANDLQRRLNVKGMHDELKELAMTFNEMLDRIENSYETQNRFTSDASHELRTPIAVIQGYVNMLDRWGKDDGEILDESIEAIKSESDNMKRLTEKLLLLAKADKGILELEFETFSLKKLINEITRETAMIDSHHKIFNSINDVDMIYADRESLKQAIRIFVDNSVKYTNDGGEISINSYFNKKKIYIEIADNGIGISKEDMDNVFNRFYRVDKSRSKDSGGHGLGLSIAKWIINEHDGKIEVKSELNKGTVITIILSPRKPSN